MNRGSAHQLGSEAEESAASMRPRFMNRGSGYRAVRTTVLFRASMRPRFMNRGSPGVEAAAASR